MSSTEEYKKVGRGGAGNYYSKADIQTSTETDLEAQPQIHTPSQSIPQPEYQHTGRGGAGNWIAPAELASQNLVQASTSPLSKVATIQKESENSRKAGFRGGRGGAGNYLDPAQEDRLRKEEEERQRSEVERKIVRDVEAGLARPGRTYGGGNGKGGGWEIGDVN